MYLQVSYKRADKYTDTQTDAEKNIYRLALKRKGKIYIHKNSEIAK